MIRHFNGRLSIALASATFVVAFGTGRAQAPRADSIVASLPPRTPLPSEAASAGITRFSFISYGDTRGRHDGVELQAEHTLVVESMLATAGLTLSEWHVDPSNYFALVLAAPA